MSTAVHPAAPGALAAGDPTAACDLLIADIAELATAPAPGPRRGAEQGTLWVIRDAALAVRDGAVVWVGPRAGWRGRAGAEASAGGRAVVPALVDPHTHAVWAGDRLDDFEARARGLGYEAILASGGGIRRTMELTSSASDDELLRLAQSRVAALIRGGAATIEVKSGYGVDLDAERRLLEVIARLRPGTPACLHATLLIHVPPTDPAHRATHISDVCLHLIPDVARRGLASAVDVFVEREAFTVEEAAQILDAARLHGLHTTVHADQFHAIGGSEMAAARGARSVDHLEAAGAAQIGALAAAGTTVGTVLPGVSLHLGIAGAPGRALVDAGVPVAIGTDLNPGSSPLDSPAAACALAVRLCGLTPAEAVVASTANAAFALRDPRAGVLLPGARADLVVVDGESWRELPYQLGGGAAETWVGGVPAGTR